MARNYMNVQGQLENLIKCIFFIYIREKRHCICPMSSEIILKNHTMDWILYCFRLHKERSLAPTSSSCTTILLCCRSTIFRNRFPGIKGCHKKEEMVKISRFKVQIPCASGMIQADVIYLQSEALKFV